MKDSIIKDYLKCVYANKFVIAGYIALASDIALITLGKPQSESLGKLYAMSVFCLSETSCSFLFPTLLGFETLKTYRKTKNYIQEFGKVREDYRKIKDNWYCSRVGIRLAAREAGLENTLEKAGAKK